MRVWALERFSWNRGHCRSIRSFTDWGPERHAERTVRLKMERCASSSLLGRQIKPLIGVYVRRADAHAGLIWEMSLETVVEGLFSGPRRGGIVRDIFEDDPWTEVCNFNQWR